MHADICHSLSKGLVERNSARIDIAILESRLVKVAVDELAPMECHIKETGADEQAIFK
jgi:hypothetical protein